jgi:tetratricopeptide (TPR) repeat protein
MTFKIKLSAFFILFLVSSQIILANYSAEERKLIVYNSYVSANMSGWENVIKEMEKNRGSLTSLANKLELAEYYYGFTAYCLGKNRKDEALKTLKKGIVLCDQIIKQDPKNATAMAFRGAFVAFEISINRLKIIILGRESLKWLNKAIETNPENIQALTDRANAYYHAPSMFGGDINKSLSYYEKALKSLEKNNLTKNNWQYLNLYVYIANVYLKLDKKEKAKAVYKTALQKEPNFKWAADLLLPTF